jgi:peptidoglycan/xylan/chitin deacetylase (PgdA/CDA1 family)
LKRNKIKNWQVQPPWWLRIWYPGATWRLPVTNRQVFITFDDGPIPEVTPWVVELLEQYNLKATFFCVGDNVRKHPEEYQLLLDHNMATGIHTYSHRPVRWGHFKEYLADIEKSRNLMDVPLFRPPHGILFPWHIHTLKKQFKKIIMWDVLTMDYDHNLSTEDVFLNMKNNVRPGSIIVFHDSLKAWPRLREVLPKTLRFLQEQGYSASSIAPDYN